MRTHRLFFALWPGDQVRHSVIETFSQLALNNKGRIIQPRNLHMTLHFIGSVTEDVKDCMQMAAQTVRSDPFEYYLDQFGSFRRAKILWMGCQKVSVELTQLHNKLAVALERCGYQSENRVFTPHLTLMRKYQGPLRNQMAKQSAEQVDFSIPWFVNEFVLVESDTDKQGVIYQVIEKYPLSCDKSEVP